MEGQPRQRTFEADVTRGAKSLQAATAAASDFGPASSGQGRAFYVERPDGRIEHRAEPVMIALALLIIPAIVLEEAGSAAVRDAAYVLNVAIWLGFAAELAFVLAVASDRRRTLRAHALDAGIVVVSVPIVPPFLQGARSLRLIRLLRFMRLGALSTRAFVGARRLFRPASLGYVSVIALLIVAVAGATLALLDSKDVPSVWDGVWWAMVTVTTVGYGDVTPTTVAGRLIAILVMLLGIAFFAILTATISATFVKQDERPDELREELRAIAARLDRIEQTLTSADDLAADDLISGRRGVGRRPTGRDADPSEATPTVPA